MGVALYDMDIVSLTATSWTIIAFSNQNQDLYQTDFLYPGKTLTLSTTTSSGKRVPAHHFFHAQGMRNATHIRKC